MIFIKLLLYKNVTIFSDDSIAYYDIILNILCTLFIVELQFIHVHPIVT